MRVYFTSARNAALKLNGIFMGFIGSFEKFADLNPKERIFAEILPENGDYYPLSCVLDENFFEQPPDFCDVYTFDGGAVIHVTAFPCRARELKVLKQTRFQDILVTLYTDGAPKLSVERKNNFSQATLPVEFAECEIASHTLNGNTLITASAAAGAEQDLIIFSDTPEKVYSGRVIDFSITDCLHTKITYNDPAKHEAEIQWTWTENSFSLKSYTVNATKQFDLSQTQPPLIPLLFFNEILVRGEPQIYLGDALKARTNELDGYLGNFAGVMSPPELFYSNYPHKLAAGLVYPRAANLFEVRFFEVKLENNLIANISPVEKVVNP